MKKNQILFLFFLLLILVSCKKDSNVEKISDINVVQLLEMNFENHDEKVDFDGLGNGYYYFISSQCAACLDLELSKIDNFNYLNEKKISIVVYDDDLNNRLSYFLKYTPIYTTTKAVAESSFMIKKSKSNEISIVKLESIL